MSAPDDEFEQYLNELNDIVKIPPVDIPDYLDPSINEVITVMDSRVTIQPRLKCIRCLQWRNYRPRSPRNAGGGAQEDGGPEGRPFGPPHPPGPPRIAGAAGAVVTPLETANALLWALQGPKEKKEKRKEKRKERRKKKRKKKKKEIKKEDRRTRTFN